MSISNLVKIFFLSFVLLSKISFAGLDGINEHDIDIANASDSDVSSRAKIYYEQEFQRIFGSNNLPETELVSAWCYMRRIMPSHEEYYPKIVEALKKIAQDTKDDLVKAMACEEIYPNPYSNPYDHGHDGDFVFFECLKILETSKNTDALRTAMYSAIRCCDFKKTKEIGLSTFNNVLCYKDRKGNIYYDPVQFLEQKFIDFWEEFDEILVSNHLSEDALLGECAKVLSVVEFLYASDYCKIINVLKRIAKNTKDDVVKASAYMMINNPRICQPNTYKDFVFVCKKLFEIIETSKNPEAVSKAKNSFNYLNQIEGELWYRCRQPPRVYLSKFIDDMPGTCSFIH